MLTGCLPSGVSAPLHAAVLEPNGRFSCSFEPEIHGFSAAAGCSAGTSSSPSYPLAWKRTVNVSVRVRKVSMQCGLCYSPVPSRVEITPSGPMHLWSLTKVFHTCGKNCGNSPDLLAGEATSKDDAQAK